MTHSPLYPPPNPSPAPEQPVSNSYYAQPQPLQPRPQPLQPRPQPSRPLAWIISGIALATLALVPQEQLFSGLLNGRQTLSWTISRDSGGAQTCQAVLNAEQRLSREQLTQVLSLAPSASPATVHETIAPPYCALSKPHQTTQREAYPLAFDPDTWFVVNYEQGAYTGYDFVFQN